MPAHWQRFEVFLERLLKDMGYYPVFHDVQFVEKRGVYRQADLVYYKRPGNGDERLMGIVEAKYSAASTVSLKLREEKEKNGAVITVDNILDELEERRRFVGADAAVLATNRRFDSHLHHQYLRGYDHITLLEEPLLKRLYARTGRGGDLQEAIRKTAVPSTATRKHTFPV